MNCDPDPELLTWEGCFLGILTLSTWLIFSPSRGVTLWLSCFLGSVLGGHLSASGSIHWLRRLSWPSIRDCCQDAFSSSLFPQSWTSLWQRQASPWAMRGRGPDLNWWESECVKNVPTLDFLSLCILLSFLQMLHFHVSLASCTFSCFISPFPTMERQWYWSIFSQGWELLTTSPQHFLSFLLSSSLSSSPAPCYL